ncbi:MAG: DUF3127 domain-containing protein [Bacteroidales bacterium]|nr:DUF3127 domain-containing protein [Bacteroidales bacterium]
MEIQGKLLQILDPVTGESSNGQWKRQDFIIETISQYPKKICFTINNDKTQISNIQIGEIITVAFNIDSREYKDRWMTNFRAWRVTPGANGQSTPLEIAGTVIRALPKREGTGAKGPWTVQEFVIELQEAYAPKVCFSVWNDRINAATLENGKTVTVSVDIDSREGKNGGWFASVQAYKAVSGIATNNVQMPTNTTYGVDASVGTTTTTTVAPDPISADQMKNNDPSEELPF